MISILKIIPVVQFMALSLHPLHISVTEIEYDEKSNALEIMMRVFIDDLELSLRNELKQPELNILDPPPGVTTDQLLGAYLGKHFAIRLDEKKQSANYLGHEREAEAFICYIEVKDVGKWKAIEVRNDIIIATHDDQSNLVHVYVKDKVKSLRLTRSKPQDRIVFDP